MASALRLHERRLAHLVGDLSELFLVPLNRLRHERKSQPVLLAWRGQRSERHVTRHDHRLPVGSINPDTFNRRLRRILAGRGLPQTALTPHMLRRSLCTNLISVGVPIHTVSRLAGHSSVNVTMRYVRLGDDPLAPFLGPDDHEAPDKSSRFR